MASNLLLSNSMAIPLYFSHDSKKFFPAKLLVLWAWIFLISPHNNAIAAGKPEVNVCYISMNNQEEAPVLSKFLSQLETKEGTATFRVQEFQKKGAKPEETLKNLIMSWQRCDVLVISGHHSGDFWGAFA